MVNQVGILIALTAGVLSFLSPCVLPLVPSYLVFVTGMSLEDLQGGVNRRATMTHAVLFVVGFSVIFILLGASASFLGQFFKAYEGWIARIGGLIIIALGLHLAGVFKLVPLMQEKRVHLSDKPAGYLGTLGVGMAFGAGWTPCIGPVLGAILTYGFSQDTMWAGVGLLAVYSLGLAIPFLIAALALDWFLQAFKRFRRFIPVVEKASGVLLVFLGILLFMGWFTILSNWLTQITPGFILDRI
jgi:cytochrome c-type biogenesis protein